MFGKTNINSNEQRLRKGISTPELRRGDNFVLAIYYYNTFLGITFCHLYHGDHTLILYQFKQ